MEDGRYTSLPFKPSRTIARPREEELLQDLEKKNSTCTHIASFAQQGAGQKAELEFFGFDLGTTMIRQNLSSVKYHFCLIILPRISQVF
jgi:hypothetical protein